MLNLDKFYKKDDNYIEVKDYTEKGYSKKAFYHEGNFSEKIYLIYKNFQPCENAYFYNGIALVRLGKIKNLENFGVFKDVVPTNSFCAINHNLDTIVNDEELDSYGFAIKPSTVLKLVKIYGIGALQMLNPEMFLIPDFEIILKERFEFYCENNKNKDDKNIEKEKEAFNKLIKYVKTQLINNENDIDIY